VRWAASRRARFLFLHTLNFLDDYSHLKRTGVRFLEEPRRELYGQVVVFDDLYGNKWDLLERRANLDA
jgi:hypothetical protein